MKIEDEIAINKWLKEKCNHIDEIVLLVHHKTTTY